MTTKQSLAARVRAEAKWHEDHDSDSALRLEAIAAELERMHGSLCALILQAQRANKRGEPLDFYLDAAMGWLKEYRDAAALAEPKWG